jgi:hypothetical protein
VDGVGRDRFSDWCGFANGPSLGGGRSYHCAGGAVRIGGVGVGGAAGGEGEGAARVVDCGFSYHPRSTSMEVDMDEPQVDVNMHQPGYLVGPLLQR